ncbi:hypothetical protein AADZ91_02005 [Colwelliaceae bacterium 6441]
MFKKTLLAFAITGAVTGAANAAEIVTGHTDAGVTLTGTAVNNCDIAAVQLGAILQNSGNSEGGSDDVITANNATGRGDVGSAVMTGADACQATQAEARTTTTIKASIEAAQVGAAQLPGAIIAGIGGYEDESTITIDIRNASVDLTKTVAPFLEYSVGAYLDSAGNPVAATGTLTVPVLDITENRVRFTVPVGQDIPALAVVSIEDVFLSATGLTGTTVVDIKSKATNTASLDYDVTDWTPVLELKPQYSAVVTHGYDAVIDVTEQRQSLLADASGLYPSALDNDRAVFTVTQEVTAGIGAELASTGAALSITSLETGGFGWMDTDGDGTISAGEIAANAAVSSTAVVGADTIFPGTLDATNTVLTYTTSADGSPTPTPNQTLDLVYQVNFNSAALHAAGMTNPLSPFIDAQKFQASFSAFSTAPVVKEMMACDAATGTVCDLDAGEWVLNGSVLTVPYMPFGDNTQIILRHTNTGDQDGNITIRYMLEAKGARAADPAWVSIPTPLPTPSTGGVLNIADEVLAAIKAHSGVTTSGKVAIEITTEAPEGDITVYAAYKVHSETDRGFVGTFGEHGSSDQNH